MPIMSPFVSLGRVCANWAANAKPWTNVYGLARTLLALGTAATLVFNRPTTLFRPVWGSSQYPVCYGLSKIGLFCLASQHLELVRWVAIALLALVASGWQPRITGLLHWWISFSLASSAVLLDGGDHVTTVLTLLLLPVALTDRRKWHWQSGSESDSEPGIKELAALFALLAIRVQVAGIYLHAAVGKLRVQEWADGTALYYWFNNPDYGATPAIWNLLAPLLRHGPVITLMTWGSILLELSLFTALVMPKKVRIYFLPLGLGFHLTIAVIHGLVSFFFAMAAALILYLRPTELPFSLPEFMQPRLAARAREIEGTPPAPGTPVLEELPVETASGIKMEASL
jgi:antimicrobial peptide system SdpB family protein